MEKQLEIMMNNSFFNKAVREVEEAIELSKKRGEKSVVLFLTLEEHTLYHNKNYVDKMNAEGYHLDKIKINGLYHLRIWW